MVGASSFLWVGAIALGAVAPVVAGSQVCANDTFRAPIVFGAEFDAVKALPVENWKTNTTVPETKLFPEDGMNLCNVTLRYRHPGHNDTTLVQVLLPNDWNGRFVAVGGGGYAAGKVDGEPIAGAVALGYAAAITDAGHDNAVWSRAPWALHTKGNLNYPLLYNFGFVSIHDLSIIGKAITEQYYGQRPKYSYFAGCSTGGRQGVTSAQMYPDDFDGILAGAPALHLPELTVTGYWAQFVMDRMNFYPPKCEMDAINNASIEYCDEIDGIKDGVISDPDACDFDPQTVVGRVVQCDNDTVTITSQGASLAHAIRTGPMGSSGKPLFVGTPHGTPFTGTLAMANTNCSTTPCAGKPFPMSVDWIKLLVRKDPDYNLSTMALQDLEDTYALSKQFLSPFFATTGQDLSRFKAARKKMISWHGMADECITLRSTRVYYDRALAADANVRDYFRYFEAPGVNHCGGPPGSFYPLRALDALARWVEGGIAPDVLIGYKMPNDTYLTEDPAESRPVCMYPNVLKYNGGDMSQWGSYRCGPKDEVSAARARARDEL